MQKKTLVAWGLGLVLAVAMPTVLVGCANANDGTDSQPAEQAPVETKTQGESTMGEYLAEHDENFGAFDEGVQSGEGVPQSLHLFVAEDADGDVYDKAAIAELWRGLCAIEVDFQNPQDVAILDGDIIFSFESGDDEVIFSFITNDYASVRDGKLYPVSDPKAVSALVDKTVALIEDESSPEPEGEEVPYEDGAYIWDADGDGTSEHMWFDFNDNGDEAPSGMSIRLFNDSGIDAYAYLDRAYSIDSVRLLEDEQGPYVVVYYGAGDYYSHDNDASCTIRLVNGELVLEGDYV